MSRFKIRKHREWYYEDNAYSTYYWVVGYAKWFIKLKDAMKFKRRLINRKKNSFDAGGKPS